MNYDRTAFLPTTKEEMQERGWQQCDVIIVTGDAYVDHPSFEAARVGRALEQAGYNTGVIDQPDWRQAGDFKRLGKPKLFFAVTGGHRESQLARLTVNKELRYRDDYSPGGITGRRPDRAAIVYCNRIRESFGSVPIVMFGLECSLKRLPYYDFWQDMVRRSFLIDGNADVIAYGMAERQIVQIAGELERGSAVSGLGALLGIVLKIDREHAPEGALRLPNYSEVLTSRKKFNDMFALYFENDDPFNGRPLLQRSSSQYLLHNPPARPLSTEELDGIYELPYTRRAHPKYDGLGGVPALSCLQFRVITHLGCLGNCSFCDVPPYQGRIVQSRSVESILREVRGLVNHPDFAGCLSDISGPVANLYGADCSKEPGACKERNCLNGGPCAELNHDPSAHLRLLSAVRAIEGVREVGVEGEIRHDLLLSEAGRSYVRELCRHHLNGGLALSPIHIVDEVLNVMNRPPHSTYVEFVNMLKEIQYDLDLPADFYQDLMAAHPGCRHEHMVELAEYLQQQNGRPVRASDYYPSPLTVSACIYYTGYHPLSGERIFRVRKDRERLRQRALIYFRQPKSKRFLRETLHKADRADLIGDGAGCLVEDGPIKPPIRGKRVRAKPAGQSHPNGYRSYRGRQGKAPAASDTTRSGAQYRPGFFEGG